MGKPNRDIRFLKFGAWNSLDLPTQNSLSLLATIKLLFMLSIQFWYIV